MDMNDQNLEPLENIIQRDKQIIIDEDYEIGLIITIHNAEGLDSPNIYSNVRSRYYRVVFWVHPNEEYRTNFEWGLPNPVWDMDFRIRLNKSLDIRFLYVEVLRYDLPGRSPDSAGCSSGITVVGRARIPLPKLSQKKGARYGLVRPEGDEIRADGNIGLTLDMRKI